MIDYLRYLTINTLTEWLCLTVAIYCLRKDKSIAWKSMIFLMVIISVTEIAGIYIKGQFIAGSTDIQSNIWLYNILLIFESFFISIMFASLLRGYTRLNLVIFGGLSLFVFLFLFDLMQHGIYKNHTVTQLVMQVLFILYSFSFFYLKLKDDFQLDLRYDAGFWWVSGTLFFYFGSVMSTLFHEILRDNYPNQNFIKIIFNILNLLLYGCWSYAFILRKLFTQRSEVSR